MNASTKQAGNRITSIRTIVTASAIGTTIEWYDFLIYATAASLVLNKLFFPTEDPLVGKLISISTVGVGFFARPFGAVILSHFGDRLGRKSPLILTMTSMGLATTLIGLLPTYASIGIAAPILLVACRLVQGIAVGGEWGGAVLMATEHSPSDKRGFFGSLVQIGFPLGMCLGTASFFALAYLDDQQFASWGWRIPFLASAVLVAIGIFVRRRIDETPDFKRVKREGKVERIPTLEVIRRHPKDLLIGLGARITEISWIYVLDGSIVIEADGMPPTRHVPGDVIFFKEGAHAIWHVENSVRKLAFCRRTNPYFLNFMVRVVSKIKSILMPGQQNRAATLSG